MGKADRRGFRVLLASRAFRDRGRKIARERLEITSTEEKEKPPPGHWRGLFHSGVVGQTETR